MWKSTASASISKISFILLRWSSFITKKYINGEAAIAAEKASKKYSKDVKKRAGEISAAHKELAEKKKQIEEMEQQLKELYSETYVLKDEITTKSQENTKDKALLKQLNEVLEQKKK